MPCFGLDPLFSSFPLSALCHFSCQSSWGHPRSALPWRPLLWKTSILIRVPNPYYVITPFSFFVPALWWYEVWNVTWEHFWGCNRVKHDRRLKESDKSSWSVSALWLRSRSKSECSPVRLTQVTTDLSNRPVLSHADVSLCSFCVVGSSIYNVAHGC